MPMRASSSALPGILTVLLNQEEDILW